MRARLRLGLLLPLACQPAGPVTSTWAPSPPRPLPTSENAEPTDPEAVAQMHELLGATEILRAAAARGDSQSVMEEAGGLARSLSLDESAPASWRDSLEIVRAEAQAIADSGEDAVVARALARVAKACGDCHLSAGVSTAVARVLKRGPAPPVGETDAEAMLMHRWSTGQMWDSLVVPAPDRWVEGTTMFVLLPSCTERPDVSSEHLERCQQAKAIARRAHLEDDASGRVTSMGRLLATCAPCHRASTAP